MILGVSKTQMGWIFVIPITVDHNSRIVKEVLIFAHKHELPTYDNAWMLNSLIQLTDTPLTVII